MTDRRQPIIDPDEERQATGIAVWLARLAAEDGGLPVRDSQGADEIIGCDATCLPA